MPHNHHLFMYPNSINYKQQETDRWLWLWLCFSFPYLAERRITYVPMSPCVLECCGVCWSAVVCSGVCWSAVVCSGVCSGLWWCAWVCCGGLWLGVLSLCV